MSAEKEFTDSKFSLDIHTMSEYQDNDDNKPSKRTGTVYYIIKEVEGVLLIYNNNRILVPESMKDKVLQ